MSRGFDSRRLHCRWQPGRAASDRPGTG